MIPVVFINCSRVPFLTYIILYMKLYESRTRNTLRALIGQRVILAETGRKGGPIARCMVTIGDPLIVTSRAAWRTVRSAVCVPLGSQYDWKPETRKKYLYPLLNMKCLRPFTVPEGVRHGRVWMEYVPKEALQYEA